MKLKVASQRFQLHYTKCWFPGTNIQFLCCMKTVLIGGGTGMIGSALSKSLIAKGYKVIILTRDEKSHPPGEQITFATWDPSRKYIDKEAISNADYIINLAGANVGAKRWTKKRKAEILTSRTDSGETLVQALASIDNKVQAVINASAMGWYGGSQRNDAILPFTEDQPAADDFLGRTCVAWENSIAPVRELGKRLVIYRCGLVFDKKGGAYEEFRKPLDYFIAPVLGSGKQIYSWLHIQDMVNIYVHALENDRIEGIYNAVTPHPVTNKQLMQMLVEISGKKALLIPVPEFALKLALGEMSIEVLKSAHLDCSKLMNTGYQFQYPDIRSAIRELEQR